MWTESVWEPMGEEPSKQARSQQKSPHDTRKSRPHSLLERIKAENKVLATPSTGQSTGVAHHQDHMWTHPSGL